MDNWVIVDTCVWITFFGKPQSIEKVTLDKLLPANRVAVIGLILFETLLGFRKHSQADWVASRMQLVNEIPVEWDDWRSAARLGRQLASQGHKLPGPISPLQRSQFATTAGSIARIRTLI